MQKYGGLCLLIIMGQGGGLYLFMETGQEIGLYGL
jgi:hypothetical protein